MTYEVKEFIQNNIELIDNNNFNEFYNKARALYLEAVGEVTSILLSSGINPLNYMTNVPIGFMYKIDVKEFEIPEDTVSIEDFAFSGCKSLESITMHQGMLRIGEDAFRSCRALKDVLIPYGVTKIGTNAFNYCTSLESVTIPNSVRSIKPYTFYNCTSLKNVNIGNGAADIQRGVFENCTSLTDVIIGSGIKWIGIEAFKGCDLLENIVYKGTVAEWSKVSQMSKLSNDISAKVVHCTDGDVILENN